MELRIVGSSSKGNGYLLEAENGDQLLIEAGCHLREYQEVGRLKRSRARGMIVSHEHGDHCKYVREFTSAGIDVYSTAAVKENNKFGVTAVEHGKTYQVGDFRVTPLKVEHDVECFAYLVHHPEMKTLFFSTDCWNLHQVVKGVSHYLIEANYQDDILDEAVRGGRTVASQADRIRLSHMSLKHCVEYLKMCEADKTARTITLIHASERHLDKKHAELTVAGQTGVPTWVAKKGLEIVLM
jgi:phosphoribosyl 1,2-cyclic phosphodiesterase